MITYRYWSFACVCFFNTTNKQNKIYHNLRWKFQNQSIHTLSVPGTFATTWVTRSSILFVQVAPNCSALCHNGWRWGFAAPTGNTLLNNIWQPFKISLCSKARKSLTSTSSKDWDAKKLRCILSITYSGKRRNYRL